MMTQPVHSLERRFSRERNRSISYENVKRKRQPSLLPFSPKLGEKRSSGPLGRARSGVMGCVVEAKAVAVTETAVHFSAQREALAAEGAGSRRGGGGQHVAAPYCVAAL